MRLDPRRISSMSKLCGTGSKRVFFLKHIAAFWLFVCFFLLPLHQLFRSHLPYPLLVSFNPTYCQGPSVKSALPPTPTCRSSPAQLVITLTITFSLSSSTPLTPTPTVRPVHSLGLPAALDHSLKCDHFRSSTTLAVQISGDNNKQSGRLVHSGKHCNSNAVKAGCCTC